MTRDDIILMAQEIATQCIYRNRPVTWQFDYAMQRVMELVAAGAAAEREACAKVCEPQEKHDDPMTAFKIAEAIRTRGQS